MITIGIILLIYFLIKYIKKKEEKKYTLFVIQKNNYVSSYLDLYEKYKNKFHKIKTNWTLECDNEAYDNVMPIDYFIYKIVENKKAVFEIRDKVIENINLYEEYRAEINEIYNQEEYSCEIIFKDLEKLEKYKNKLIKAYELKPVTYFKIYVSIIYGKNSIFSLSKKEHVFYDDDFERVLSRISNKHYDRYLDQGVWDALCHVERAKVTNSLKRFIKNRDGHRCKNCGSTNNLEIDHIIPISKGGKSSSDNLQTLCHRCNQNKGNIIMPGTVTESEFGFCEKCGAPLVKRHGSYGVFLGCSNYPNCNYTKNII